MADNYKSYHQDVIFLTPSPEDFLLLYPLIILYCESMENIHK